MQRHSCFVPILLALAGVASGTATLRAQTWPTTTLTSADAENTSRDGQFQRDPQQLYRRLEAAEQRIRQLEIQRLPEVGASGLGIQTGMPTFGASTQDDIAARLEELENAYKKDKEAAAQKKADDAKKPTQRWTGRIHADYWGFPNESPLANFLETGSAAGQPQDFIGFRRLRLGLAGNILETMEYKIEFDFAVPEDLVVKDAYLGWNELPIFHTLLLGNQKRPYGLDHLNSSRYNVFMERPFVVEAFNQDARRFGLASYGVSDDEAWNWRFGPYLLRDIQSPGNQRSDDYQVELAGRLANTIWYDESSDGRGYAHWAVSGTLAFPDSGDQARFRTRPEARTANRWIDTGVIPFGQTYQLIGLEGVINLGALSIVGEYQNAWVQRASSSGLPDLDVGGGYIYVAYFLTGEHTPWERDSGTIGRTKPFENFFMVQRCRGGRGWGLGAWQVAARYSHGDFSDNDIFGGVGDNFTLGLNWWWTPYGRLQFNYIHGSISDRVVAGVPYTSGDYDIFGTRFMVDF